MSLNINNKLYAELPIQRAVGDGNCAFNAFILGFFTEDVLNEIEKKLNPDTDENYQFFVAEAAKLLKVNATWAAVRKAILALRQQSLVELQKTLAPLMRNLSVSWGLTDPTHKPRTQQPMLSAFDDYVNARKGKAVFGVKDDIFDLSDIIKKFEEFASAMDRGENEQVVINRLTDWWENDSAKEVSGYKQYMAAMRQPFRDAGDLQLQPLANGLKVNLDVMLKDNETGKAVRHNVCTGHYGRMPIETIALPIEKGGFSINPDQIQKLRASGIVNPDPDLVSKKELFLLPETPESLVALTNMSCNINAAVEAFRTPKPIVITLTNPEGKHWDNVLPDIVEDKNNNHVSDIVEDTLKLAEKWHIERVETHYKKIAENLQDEAVPPEEGVTYHFSATNKSFFVSKKTQERLDEEYAKELQLEEYKNYLSKTKKP